MRWTQGGWFTLDMPATTHRALPAKIARMTTDPAANGMELATRHLSARSWADTRITITPANEVIVHDTKTGGKAAYAWTGGRFSYLGAR